MSTNANFGWAPTVKEISNVDLVLIVYHIFIASCGYVVLYDMCHVSGPMHA